MTAVYSWPTAIHLVTSGQEFVYTWQPASGIFVCLEIPYAGEEKEVSVIKTDLSEPKVWFVLVQGHLEKSVFRPDREAFRTQEEFWIADYHEWQVNQNDAGGVSVWQVSEPYLLTALTFIPSETAVVSLCARLQLASTC